MLTTAIKLCHLLEAIEVVTVPNSQKFASLREAIERLRADPTITRNIQYIQHIEDNTNVELAKTAKQLLKKNLA